MDPNKAMAMTLPLDRPTLSWHGGGRIQIKGLCNGYYSFHPAGRYSLITHSKASKIYVGLDTKVISWDHNYKMRYKDWLDTLTWYGARLTIHGIGNG